MPETARRPRKNPRRVLRELLPSWEFNKQPKTEKYPPVPRFDMVPGDDEFNNFVNRIRDDSPYFNRSGERVTARQFSEIIEDIQYRLIARSYTYKGMYVSTVFLGLDQGFYSKKPEVYETMVFGGALAQDMMRASTLEEALACHHEMTALIKRCPHPRIEAARERALRRAARKRARKAAKA